ncbi:MAG: TAXI family TRAP transporter solute-binding subunit [Pseudomonadota bacterium]
MTSMIRWMSLAITLALTLSALGFHSAASAQNQKIRISTGSSTGTYIKFGQAIRQVAPPDIEVTVETSLGSVQNLQRLLATPEEIDDPDGYYQLAIVQEDVLDSLLRHAEGDEVLEAIVRNLVVVLPLYNEEIHIFSTSPDIQQFSDLRGQEVIGGQALSGTLATSKILYDLVGFDTTEPFLSVGAAKDSRGELADGLFAAVIDVGGAPTSLATSMIRDDKVHLVEISEANFPVAESPYSLVRITDEQYEGLDKSVSTLAVRSLLIAYGYKTGPHCNSINTLIGEVLNNLHLLPNIHEKWEKVDPALALEHELLWDCVRPTIEAYVSR